MIEFPITLTSGGSVCLPGHAFALALGYTKNRGVYRLAVTASGEWEGLAIRCFWHVPDGKDPASSLVDGYVDVPASVTAQPGSGCITFEGSDGAKVMTSADLRYRVSANSGTEDGTEPEPGTPAWQQLVDAVHADAQDALVRLLIIGAVDDGMDHRVQLIPQENGNNGRGRFVGPQAVSIRRTHDRSLQQTVPSIHRHQDIYQKSDKLQIFLRRTSRRQ